MTAASIERVGLRQRREIFAALVAMQDAQPALNEFIVHWTRETICSRFGITSETLRHVEREGSAAAWPPLEP